MCIRNFWKVLTAESRTEQERKKERKCSFHISIAINLSDGIFQPLLLLLLLGKTFNQTLHLGVVLQMNHKVRKTSTI